METIYLLWGVMEQHLIFIDSEKVYDRVPREILWKALEYQLAHYVAKLQWTYAICLLNWEKKLKTWISFFLSKNLITNSILYISVKKLKKNHFIVSHLVVNKKIS